MYVRVDGAGLALVEADNFRQFAVVVEGEGKLTELDGFGVVDAAGEHVFLNVDAVRGLAGSTATAEWVRQFEGMVAFAREKGWVDDAGRVRAHVERRGTAG